MKVGISLCYFPKPLQRMVVALPMYGGLVFEKVLNVEAVALTNIGGTLEDEKAADVLADTCVKFCSCMR